MSNALAAVSLAVDLLTAAAELSLRLQAVSTLLQRARAEGRDLTDEELASVVATDDEARAKLQAAIDRA